MRPTRLNATDISALKRKAEILGAGINEIAGRGCSQGSMGVRPFDLPEKTIDISGFPRRARVARSAWDSAYCLALGRDRSVVPGRFGQKAGTFHFRTTFLPPQDEIESLCSG
jgi:alanine transaminase